MSIPSNEPQNPLTATQIDAWLAATSLKHMQLYLQGIEPLYNLRRYDHFLEMSNLLLEAIEEVRVMSAVLRDDSETLRRKASALRGYSNELIERSPLHPEEV